jgi:hypothetical protein
MAAQQVLLQLGQAAVRNAAVLEGPETRIDAVNNLAATDDGLDPVAGHLHPAPGALVKDDAPGLAGDLPDLAQRQAMASQA